MRLEDMPETGVPETVCTPHRSVGAVYPVHEPVYHQKSTPGSTELSGPTGGLQTGKDGQNALALSPFGGGKPRLSVNNPRQSTTGKTFLDIAPRGARSRESLNSGAGGARPVNVTEGSSRSVALKCLLARVYTTLYIHGNAIAIHMYASEASRGAQ
eukprot:1007063-Prorocentrum_minimum.AAC.4